MTKLKILEQEAKMNRFKKEMALKAYFKLHSHKKAQQVAEGYTKWVLLMRPQNYGALLCSQNDIYHPLPSQIVRELQEKSADGVRFLKEIYEEKIQFKIESKFRPLEILKEIELQNDLKITIKALSTNILKKFEERKKTNE